MPCILLTLLATVGAGARTRDSGALRVHRIFGDHMVIQRDKPITVWGWGRPGDTVSVQLGSSKAQGTARAQGGRWEVTFPARPASAVAQTLTVRSGDEALTMENIVIGDVWVMNGQSNMAFGLGKVYRADLETACAHLPLLRKREEARQALATLDRLRTLGRPAQKNDQ